MLMLPGTTEESRRLRLNARAVFDAVTPAQYAVGE